MATRKKNSEDFSQVKALNPRDADTKYYGEEPLFVLQPEPTLRATAFGASFNWYTKFYAKKDAREFIVQYLEHHKRLADAKIVRKTADNQVINTYGWLARMTLRGLELTEEENVRFQNEINRLIKSVNSPELKESKTSIRKEVVEVVANRPNVQDIMKEKAREAGGELEGIFDDFILTGAPSKFATKAMDEVAKKNVLPQHISLLTDVWKKKLDEFNELYEGKDKQLNEGYSYLNKTQVKNIIKFIEQVISDLNSYISVKKANKTPRVRKAVPVEKIVSKLKYLKTFKDTASKLDLVSISPVKLHGASEAWVYDTAKRKLHHYIADEYSKAFTVKGNTLLGFDAGKSEIKTLRKPAEQIKEVMGSKPAARKFFDAIKAVGTKPNGRFNDNIIILKAF